MARKHLAVASQNSPQLKRVAYATNEVNPGKTARASSGLATLPQETQAGAQPCFAARRAALAQSGTGRTTRRCTKGLPNCQRCKCTGAAVWCTLLVWLCSVGYGLHEGGEHPATSNSTSSSSYESFGREAREYGYIPLCSGEKRKLFPSACDIAARRVHASHAG